VSGKPFLYLQQLQLGQYIKLSYGDNELYQQIISSPHKDSLQVLD